MLKGYVTMYCETDFDKIDMEASPPAEEPERQYYFIERTREYIAEKTERLGRPLRAAVTTFGCQVITVHEIKSRKNKRLFSVYGQQDTQSVYSASF